MALARWDPFSEMMSLREAMNRLFEESFVAPRRAEAPSGISFPVDVVEREDGYEVKAQLPGLKPEDVDITITGNMLTIRGERTEEREEREGNYIVRECRYGTLTRSLALPANLDAAAAEARFAHGTLTLTLPKAEEAKPKRIQVRSTGVLGGEQARQVGGQGKSS